MAQPPKEIIVRHGSRMANRMLQYLVAKEFQRKFPEYTVCGYDIPEWGLKGARPAPGRRQIPKIEIQRFDTPLIETAMAEGRLDRLMLKSVCGNMEALPSRAFANSLFDASHVEAFETGEDDIVMHVRLEDILVPGRHKNYGPLPIGFYKQVVEASGKRPVFVGQMGSDWYSDMLRAAFPDALFLEGGSVLHDFETIRRAKHIILAISTFSWMAAWLSEATTIHYPLSGLFHPLQVPGVDMMPLKDPRYAFYLFPERAWLASPAQQEDLRAPFTAEALSAEAAEALQAQSAQAWAPQLDAWRSAFTTEIARGTGAAAAAE
ncbi:alpha-1,2-fucosyltransferase [Pseudoruegeria sp. SHC-113]|uniref:alpha-1,2-fucosyltransferase n=1 Tax=Pseudoruegeria sp. SHC-113 TaxID=2855439 RepID=UPI0021BA5A4F|nr:alpha-1,2-fucosyltransferase [Pseudoruegeria sp. SHC-113]MCT8162013.1 alpha-1,2-fucosyltransferase [Pseudoruegeria sp. SHC-113]